MTKHSLISYIKSGIRILGCALGLLPIAFGWRVGLFAACFLIAEIFGIAEEWGATY